MGTGFRTATSGGVAAPPYTNGPYTFSEDITFEGEVTVQGDFTFGDAATDDLTVNGDLIIADDRKLHLGTNEDWSIEFDEDGTDEVRITGADMLILGNSGAQKLQFRDSGLYLNSDNCTTPSDL